MAKRLRQARAGGSTTPGDPDRCLPEVSGSSGGAGGGLAAHRFSAEAGALEPSKSGVFSGLKVSAGSECDRQHAEPAESASSLMPSPIIASALDPEEKGIMFRGSFALLGISEGGWVSSEMARLIGVRLPAFRSFDEVGLFCGSIAPSVLL